MENNYHLLLYSKYSSHSKKLLDIIRDNSQANFSFIKFICIDNIKVRQRIKNSEINIEKVPCMLIFKSKDNVEIYEGNDCFSIIENIINEYETKIQLEMKQREVEMLRMQKEELEEKKRRYEEETQKLEEDEYEKEKEENLSKYRQRKNSENISNLVDLEDLEDKEEENEELDDRNISIPPPRRIRKDDRNYESNDEFFQGETPNMRKGPTNSVKPNTNKTTKDANSVKALADAMAKDREDVENLLNPPKNRPKQVERV
jgi:hypothetical protein